MYKIEMQLLVDRDVFNVRSRQDRLYKKYLLFNQSNGVIQSKFN